MQSALRWGVGLATTGFAVNRLLGDAAHRGRILGGIPAAQATIATTATTPVTLKRPPVKALHIYDHCPYCVRVQLAAGWDNVPHDLVVYGYGDFEGPKALTGKKVLPVLEIVDENGDTKYMKESLDLVEYLDGFNGDAHRKLAPASRKDLQEWLAKAKKSHSILTRGALLKMPVKDWANEEDVTYAVSKYTRLGFDYEAAEKSKAEHLEKMDQHLEELNELLHSEESANSWGRSMDDILLLPHLRNLTCVKGLKWPTKVKAYLDKNLSSAGIESYEKDAV